MESRLLAGGVAIAIAAGLFMSACTSIKVDTIHLTNDRYPSKESSRVAVLPRMPEKGYDEIADLAARGERADVEDLQQKLLERAAELGADAMVFSGNQEHIKEGIAYTPIYDPWGYQNPYGPDPWGYDDVGYGGIGYGSYGYMPQRYSIQINSLKGVAIRRTTPSSP